MPRYLVEVRSTRTSEVVVEADSKADATTAVEGGAYDFELDDNASDESWEVTDVIKEDDA